MKKDSLEILLEDMRGKFDLVLEEHTALDKKIDSRLDQLDQKIDLVDFKVEAHRADTEAHPGLYRVSEPQSKK